MEGFTDVSGLIRCGVYLLLQRGRVVFVGKAGKSMLAKIAAHRSLARKSVPDWLPIKGIPFDQVLIKTVHPDQLESTYLDLVLEFNPHYNLPAPAFAPPPASAIHRRI